jgi:RimJ/RimL family protein N-acetyltransferase
MPSSTPPPPLEIAASMSDAPSSRMGYPCGFRRMKLESRGLATDLMLASMAGSVVDGDDYIVVRTASCPAYWWGNFILFPQPPTRGRELEWEAVFDREVACMPGIGHRHFAWDTLDGSVGDASGFIERGYELGQSIFLMARKVHRSPRHAAGAVVRAIQGDDEWKHVLDLQLASIDPSRNTESYRSFLASQVARNRRLVEAGHGKWFAAFHRSRCVATMGVFVRDGLARCQSVATRPEFRRQGYCSTLVHDVCDHAFDAMQASEIVILTDSRNPAARVYESVGFRVEERVASLSISTRGR